MAETPDCCHVHVTGSVVTEAELLRQIEDIAQRDAGS